MTEKERDRNLWMMIRQACLLLVDAIERRWTIDPRTAELRRERKRQPGKEC